MNHLVERARSAPGAPKVVRARRRSSSRASKRRVARQRGVASIEALMGLFVLITLWVGADYVAKGHVLSLRAQAHARACGFAYAASSCRSVPRGCEAHASDGKAPDGVATLSAARYDASGDDHRLDDANQTLDQEMKGLFKKRTTATSSFTRMAPGFFGGGSETTVSDFTLPCNTRPRKHWSEAKGLTDGLLSKFNERSNDGD